MKKVMNGIGVFLAGAAIAVALMGLVMFDFKVWRLKHPTAPTWTYFW